MLRPGAFSGGGREKGSVKCPQLVRSCGRTGIKMDQRAMEGVCEKKSLKAGGY